MLSIFPYKKTNSLTVNLSSVTLQPSTIINERKKKKNLMLLK